MQKIVFGLYGKGDCGKTATVIQASDFVKNTPGANLVLDLNNSEATDDDIIRAFDVDGVTAGFSSGGDNKKAVMEGLATFAEHDIDIIVCVTRETHATKSTVRKWCESNNRALHWIPQTALAISTCDNADEVANLCITNPYPHAYAQINIAMAGLINQCVQAELVKRRS